MVDSVSFYFMCSTYSINDICFNLKCSSFFTFIQSIDIHSLYFHTQRKLKRKDFFSFLNVIVVLSFQTILDEIFGSSKFNIQCHSKKNWKHWTSKVSNRHFWVFWLKVFSLCWLKLSFFRPAEKTTCFSWRRGRRARYGEEIVGDLQKVGVALDSWHAP